MFNDKVQAKDFEKMDPEYQDLLRKVLTIQSDCEIGGPHLYVETMLPGAPTRLDQLLVARTAAEEMDHFRKFLRLAGEIGLDVSFVLSQPNQKRYVEAFRGTIATWEDYAVFGFLIDRIGRYQLEEFIGCTYAPIEPLLPDIIQEELGHIDFGATHTRELAEKSDESRAKVQKALDYWYVKGLDMFGHSVSKRSERYCHWGIKRRSNAEARAQYIKEVNPLIESMGLKVPDPLKGRKYL
jgi:1,2-phenylacetyl-CoA epoxidase catalytic subunit